MRSLVNLSIGLAIVLGGSSLPAPGSVGISGKNAEASLQSRNSITGFVFNEARRPLSDVHVELLDDLGVTISRTKTSGAGLYTFRGLSDGIFYVKIMPYGINFIGDQKRVSLVSISARPGSGSTSEQVDFYLKARNIQAGPLGAPGVIFTQEVPSKAERLYEEGIGLIADKRDDAGLEKLRLAIEAFPTYFAALDRLGTEYVFRGFYKPAEVLLAKAVEINQRSFSSWLGLGLSQFRLQQVPSSVKSLKRATELSPDSINAHLWHGISLHADGKLNDAEAALIQANKLGKGEVADVHWQLARVYKDQGRYADSAKSLELVLRYKPDAENAEEIKKLIATLKKKASSGS